MKLRGKIGKFAARATQSIYAERAVIRIIETKGHFKASGGEGAFNHTNGDTGRKRSEPRRYRVFWKCQSSGVY